MKKKQFETWWDLRFQIFLNLAHAWWPESGMGEIEILSLSTPLNWAEQRIFFSVLFKSLISPVSFSPFSAELVKITRAERL